MADYSRAGDIIRVAGTGEFITVTAVSASAVRWSPDRGAEIQREDGAWVPYEPDEED